MLGASVDCVAALLRIQSPWLGRASPDVAVAVGTAGLLLIMLELNRPGRILPGTVGLGLMLFTIARLCAFPLSAWAVCLVLLSGIVLLLNWWRPVVNGILALTAAGMAVGLRFLLKRAVVTHVDTSVAICCGLTIGVLSALLTRIAYRARRAKAID